MPKDIRPKARTQIWAEGSQHPPFEPRAFARATLHFGRGSMAALLRRCAASAAGFGAEIDSGRFTIPEDRLGRTGRYLPGHHRVAAAVAGMAELLARSADVAGADSADAPPLPRYGEAAARPDPAPAPAEAGDPADAAPAAEAPAASLSLLLADGPAEPPAPAAPDDALSAIRQMMCEAPAAPPPPAAHALPGIDIRASAPAGDPLPDTPAQTSRLRGWAMGAAALVLGYGLLAMALPWGAICAALAHLNGEDLRKLEA